MILALMVLIIQLKIIKINEIHKNNSNNKDIALKNIREALKKGELDNY